MDICDYCHVLGLALRQAGNVAQTAQKLIVPFLVVMLFGVF